ncbi:MAG: DRTGG domain-containing protein [Clostridia bacterium]|nr:DRTGG domain-containing protein [Clostridia bacterium]
MTVDELVQKLGYKIITGEPGHLKSQVTGVYTCDLLSHAMAKLNQGELWITVHTNLNVIAVASLSDVSCVLIPEDILIEEQTLERAREKGVIILASPLSAARICHEVLSALEDAS